MGDGQMFENRVVVSPIKIIRKRHGIILAGSGRFVQNHDAIGVGIRQRAKQNSVDNAENRSVCADAEREGQDSDQSESRRPAELAQSKLYIIHITRCVALESGRYVWRDAPETNTPTARRRPGRSRSRPATTDRRVKSGKVEPPASGRRQRFPPDQKSNPG